MKLWLITSLMINSILALTQLKIPNCFIYMPYNGRKMDIQNITLAECLDYCHSDCHAALYRSDVNTCTLSTKLYLTDSSDNRAFKRVTTVYSDNQTPAFYSSKCASLNQKSCKGRCSWNRGMRAVNNYAFYDSDYCGTKKKCRKRGKRRRDKNRSDE